MGNRNICNTRKEWSNTNLYLLERCPPPFLPKYRTFMLNSTQYGLNFMVLLLSVIVVPAQVERLVTGQYKGRAMGGMIAGGAVATFVVCPLIGMLSDRCGCRVGKRRPIILVATSFLCLGLLGMAMSAPDISVRGNPMDKVSSLSISDKKHIKVDSVVVRTAGRKKRELHCDIDLVARRCHTYQIDRSHILVQQEPPSYEVGNVASHAHGVVIPRFTYYKSEEIKPVGNLALYIVCFFLVVISQAAVAIPYISLVADKTHPSQRGFNSGVMGAMVLLGSVSGAIVGISFTRIGVLCMYAIIIGVVVICVLITVFSVSEDAGVSERRPPDLSCKLLFFGFLKPMKDHDFRWVFVTRFLMQQGVSTVTGFLEYWLDDVIPLPYCWSAATSVSLLFLPLLFAAAMSSLICGMISDKTGHRRIIVAIAAFIMAVGSFVNAFISGKYAYFIAAFMSFIIGLGFGAFQSVDFALVMDILSDDGETATNIAVWHQSLVLPQAIATPLGGVILDVFEKVNCKIALGYIILFIVASLYFAASGLFVFKIRKAR